MTNNTEQAVQAISLYHALLSESDKQTLFEIAGRALRKAVSVGRAQIICARPVELVEQPQQEVA